jgi:glycosyltransferase involved in cell wall biosynthesis
MTDAAGFGVSFVVTVYNKREYLPAVVAGLAAQRGDFPREFIFVDDGSTDGSAEAVRQLTSGWSGVQILGQANLGPSRATNRGLAAARHKLVKLVDGDDVLLPDAAALLREALLRHDAAVLAHGRTDDYADATEAVARLQTPPAGAAAVTAFDALPRFLRSCDLGPSACMVRREAALLVGGCDERVFIQDYSLFLRLAAAGPFLRLDAPVALLPGGPRRHLNDGGPQVPHDLNLALFHFLSEREVPAHLRRRAVHRGLQRAWKWARRREGATMLDPAFRMLLAGYVARRARSLALLQQSCAAFAASRPVRRL